MDHDLLLHRLTYAKRIVLEAEARISRLRRRVSNLRSDGKETANAIRLLEIFEKAQQTNVANLDGILSELRRKSKFPPE